MGNIVQLPFFGGSVIAAAAASAMVYLNPFQSILSSVSPLISLEASGAVGALAGAYLGKYGNLNQFDFTKKQKIMFVVTAIASVFVGYSLSLQPMLNVALVFVGVFLTQFLPDFFTLFNY